MIGLDTGWNCHISLADDDKASASTSTTKSTRIKTRTGGPSTSSAWQRRQPRHTVGLRQRRGRDGSLPNLKFSALDNYNNDNDEYDDGQSEEPAQAAQMSDANATNGNGNTSTVKFKLSATDGASQRRRHAANSADKTNNRRHRKTKFRNVLAAPSAAAAVNTTTDDSIGELLHDESMTAPMLVTSTFNELSNSATTSTKTSVLNQRFRRTRRRRRQRQQRQQTTTNDENDTNNPNGEEISHHSAPSLTETELLGKAVPNKTVQHTKKHIEFIRFLIR